MGGVSCYPFNSSQRISSVSSRLTSKSELALLSSVCSFCATASTSRSRFGKTSVTAATGVIFFRPSALHRCPLFVSSGWSISSSPYQAQVDPWQSVSCLFTAKFICHQHSRWAQVPPQPSGHQHRQNQQPAACCSQCGSPATALTTPSSSIRQGRANDIVFFNTVRAAAATLAAIVRQ